MYNQPVTATYTRAAATISTAATLFTVKGPAGHKGRLVGISANVTTAVTTLPTLLTVGSATDADAYGTLSVPVVAASSAATYNNATINDIDTSIIPADSVVVIATGGEGDAGAADIAVIIDWFK